MELRYESNNAGFDKDRAIGANLHFRHVESLRFVPHGSGQDGATLEGVTGAGETALHPGFGLDAAGNHKP